MADPSIDFQFRIESMTLNEQIKQTFSTTAIDIFINASGSGHGKEDDSQVVKVHRKLKKQ